MDSTFKHQYCQLPLRLIALIEQSGCDPEIKRDAHLVVGFYLVTPLLNKDAEFFKGWLDNTWLDQYTLAEMSALAEWVPLMSHFLKTGVDLLMAELDRLVEARTIAVLEPTLPDPQGLINRFVSALAGFIEVDHNDYQCMRTALVSAITAPEEAHYVPLNQTDPVADGDTSPAAEPADSVDTGS